MNDKILKQSLDQLKEQQFKKSYLLNYYDGKHDILKNYRMEKSRSNMKVIVNYPKRFVEERISYILGNHINYVSKSHNEEALDIIDLNFSHWEKLHNQELVRQSQIYGESYEVSYINIDGEFRCSVLNPLNCIVFQSGDAEKRVTLAVHLYTDTDENEFIDVYDNKKITTYAVDGDKFTKVNEIEHIFKGVPVVVCKSNARSHSLIEDIKSLNDSLNNIISDSVNEVADHRSAYLKLINSRLEKEDADEMKQSGIIEVAGDKADVDWLIKNINDNFIQNTLENLENKIYKMASSVDTNEKMQSNLSGVALRSRLISLEFVCSTIEAQLEFVIKQRLKHFFNFHYKKTGQSFDYRDIKIKTTANIPSDLVGLADVVSKLKDVVSQETLLSILPFVENPQLEKQKFDDEQRKQLQSLESLR
ncbi:SPP1 family phage portal protein [Desulfitispora alkaliphila]|uniref:phage portal protein n=1 Tax=Desulfitispora alkaliphila TaxID=622674 RepID=UPI003D256E6F